MDTPNDDLAWLLANTVSLSLELNDHRRVYEPLARHMEDLAALNCLDDDDWAEAGDRERALEADILVELIVWPDTPVGHYRVYGVDPAKVLAKARSIVEANRVARAAAAR